MKNDISHDLSYLWYDQVLALCLDFLFVRGQKIENISMAILHWKLMHLLVQDKMFVLTKHTNKYILTKDNPEKKTCIYNFFCLTCVTTG
jgi:hypothetical protein